MTVVWHDLECGSYTEDLALWRELASEHGDPVLDIGAGTGRVTLELARAGHQVTALDHDGELLAALTERAAGLDVGTAVADARHFELEQIFALCVVPMQTIQLLGETEGRIAFLRCARRHVKEGGLLAIALAEELETFDSQRGGPKPLPDIADINGTVYCSQPTAIAAESEGFTLIRRRERVNLDGRRHVQEDAVRMARLTAEQLEREGLSAGFLSGGRSEIAATAHYAGSCVVMLHG